MVATLEQLPDARSRALVGRGGFGYVRVVVEAPITLVLEARP